MDMSEHSIKDLGVFVGLFAENGYYKMARSYLNEMVLRLGAMEALSTVPIKTAEERPLTHQTLTTLAEANATETAVAAEAVKAAAEVALDEPEPEPGMIRDEAGKVTHVSVKHGELGYDPEIHENTALKIFCDGTNVENAHTANTVEGVVKYHKKNEQGRIKTLEVRGKVEIRGVD